MKSFFLQLFLITVIGLGGSPAEADYKWWKKLTTRKVSQKESASPFQRLPTVLQSLIIENVGLDENVHALGKDTLRTAVRERRSLRKLMPIKAKYKELMSQKKPKKLREKLNDLVSLVDDYDSELGKSGMLSDRLLLHSMLRPYFIKLLRHLIKVSNTNVDWNPSLKILLITEGRGLFDPMTLDQSEEEKSLQQAYEEAYKNFKEHQEQDAKKYFTGTTGQIFHCISQFGAALQYALPTAGLVPIPIPAY